MHACTCIDRSSRPPNAPPTPASVSRTISGGRASAAQICRWSTCSHCVATYSSTPPSGTGTASPDSGAEEGLVLHPYLVLTDHHDVGHGFGLAFPDLQVPDEVALRVQDGPFPRQLADRPG